MWARRLAVTGAPLIAHNVLSTEVFKTHPRNIEGDTNDDRRAFNAAKHRTFSKPPAMRMDHVKGTRPD